MQRIMIVSDTHRKHDNLKKALLREGKIDLLIHLGDAEGQEEEIMALAACKVEMIAGNNDFFSELDREKEITIGKYHVLLTHGHYYYVTVGLDMIRNETMGRSKDIVMFGHTHRPLIEIGEQVTVLNPGSISYPRQSDKKPTYIMMETDREGAVAFQLKSL